MQTLRAHQQDTTLSPRNQPTIPPKERCRLSSERCRTPGSLPRRGSFGSSRNSLQRASAETSGLKRRPITKHFQISVRTWISMYRRALASGHCFSRFMQANCLMLSRCTFPRFTASLTTRSCMCPSVQTKVPGNLRLSLLFSSVWMIYVTG